MEVKGFNKIERKGSKMKKDKVGKMDDIKPIIYEIGHGFMETRYRGATFTQCVVENIKNSRDWQASKILIRTAEPSEYAIIDNGVGMSEINRNAFVSINKTTAKGSKQSGKFDTGAKMMLLAFSSRFQVVTFPKDDAQPGRGYLFGCLKSKYEGKLITGTKEKPEIIYLPSKNWPYPFETGSAITYIFEDQTRKSIHRGRKLARLLAARLPSKFHSIVEVDREPIPEKEIIGDYYRFSLTDNSSSFGHLEMELYRPKNPTPQDKLWFGSVEIGEVIIDDFVRALNEDLRAYFPTDYLVSGICGTITCDLIKRHTNEDRKTLSDYIEDDATAVRLVQIMREHLEPIKQALQIRSGNRKDHAADEGELELLRQLFNKKFDPNDEGPPQVKLTVKKPAKTTLPGSEKSSHAITIHGFRGEKEYELGEIVEIYATLRDDLKSEFDENDIVWHTEKSGCGSIRIKGNSIKMKSSTIGDCELVADLPGTLHNATAHYKIVDRRFFRLSPPFAKINTGESITIHTQNVDKLSADGKISWSLKGPGRFETKDIRTVIYHAEDDEGEATLTAADTQNRDVYASCEIIISYPRPKNCIKIGSHWFLYDIIDVDKPGCPATMLQGGAFGAASHQLFFNRRTPGWDEAKAEGRLAEFLGQAAAMIYPGFRRFVLEEGDEPESLDTSNLSRLYLEMVDEGYQIFLGTFKEIDIK